jgi:hypothetical protein
MIYACDLCGGAPRCVAACTEGALAWEPTVRETVSLAGLKDGTAALTPDEKRARYAEHLAERVRAGWEV